jgi:hypothetical protein
MQAHVFAMTHTHAGLQPPEAIPAIHALPDHLPVLSSQHDMDTLIAEARSGVQYRQCEVAVPTDLSPCSWRTT